MDVSIINTLIVNITTLTATLFGYYANNSNKKNILSKQTIQNQTLTEVLVPLINVLKPINNHTYDEKKQTLLELLNKKQMLIPANIETSMEKVLSSTESSCKDKQNELLKIAESYAHQYRKDLKYPYNVDKIKPEYIIPSNKTWNAKRCIVLVVLAICLLCDIYVFGISISAIINGQFPKATLLNIIPVLICFFEFFYSFFSE